MKQTIRLTESELTQLIESQVVETLQDEGFLGDLWAGAKNAFGGDASRIGTKAANGVNAMKNGVKNVGKSITNSVNNVKRGVQTRANAWKAGAQANANNSKLNDIVSKLQDLQKSGVLHGAKTDAAVDTLIRQIGMLTRGNNSTAAAFRNQVGR